MNSTVAFKDKDALPMHASPSMPDPAPSTMSPPETASSPALPKSATPATPAAATLAALLATALADVEGLREELATARTRAERAERLLATFSNVSASLAQPNGDSSADASKTAADADLANADASPHSNPPLPQATVTLLLALDERTVQAERARDEANARIAALASSWVQLDAYLQVVEARAIDARTGFSRIVKEGGGGGKLVLLDVPAPGASTYDASGSRHQRALSLYDAPPPRAVHHDRRFSGLPLPPLPPAGSAHGHGERNSHGKRPRAESIDAHGYVMKKPREGDYEYASQYRTGSTSTNPGAAYPLPPQPQAQASSSSTRQTHHSHSLPHYPPERQHSHPHAQARSRSRSGASDDVDAMLLETANPSPRRDSIPMVGGRSTTLDSVSGPERSGSLNVTYSPTSGRGGKPLSAAATSTTPFPATNSANQRICRQCGLPGRYKDGKCVEKWGPGPLGPGTVCDRCRKKMKRVERRGTLEALAQAQAQQGGMPQPPGLVKKQPAPEGGSGLARTDTLLNSSPYRESAGLSGPGKESSIRSSLAGPGTARGAILGVAGAGSSAAAILPPGVRTHSPIPMHLDEEEDDDADGDADADAEADELDDDADGEADLLDAVDAAESGHRSRHLADDD